MKKRSSFRSGRDGSVLFIVGWILAVAVGIGLLWLGFALSKGDRQPAVPQPSVTVPATPLPSPTMTHTPVPTATPLPTATPEPTAIPATATPAPPSIVAGADGVNVRSGPGTNFTRLGYLDPGAQAQVIGRYSDWWQILYDGAPGWVFGELVTASNADDVPQVEPPPSPTPPPPTVTPVPTAVPPTATPANFRGLVADDFQVEGAPGPYAASINIWFNMWIHNTGGRVEYQALGAFVEETGQFQKSWMHSHFEPGQRFQHRDRINQFSLGPGTYHLWMMICFNDGQCFKMLGPVKVIVQ